MYTSTRKRPKLSQAGILLKVQLLQQRLLVAYCICYLGDSTNECRHAASIRVHSKL